MPAQQSDTSGSGADPREHFDRMPNEWHRTVMGEMLPHLCWTTDQEFIPNAANRDYLARFYRETFPDLPVPDEHHLKPALFNAMALSLQATGSPYLKDWLTERTTPETLRAYRYPFVDEYVGVHAGTYAIRSIHSLGRGLFDSYQQLRDRSLELLKAAGDALSSVNARESHCRLLADATARGIPVRRYMATIPVYQFGYGYRQRRLWRGYTSKSGHVGTLLATNKQFANEVLRIHGFPVPAQRVVANIEDAMAAARAIGYPVVVKPARTDHGKAVSTRISNDNDLAAAYGLAAPYGSTIVERHINGHDYRLTVVDGRCVSVLRRDPAQVEGDGIADIATLVARAAEERLRDAAHRNYPLPPPDDPHVVETLRSQGLTAWSVPEAGRTVFLRTNANVSTGGRYHDVLPEAHPENVRLAERIAEAIGLDHAGIDFISPDIGTPWHGIDCGICEVNPTPGVVITPHFDALLDYLVEAGNWGRIPIVALVGESAETDAAFDNIAGLTLSAGLVTGSVRRGVARVGQDLVATGTNSINDLFDVLVGDTKVAFILLQIAPAELVEKGLKAPYLDLVGYFADDGIIEQIMRSRTSMAFQASASLRRPGIDDLLTLVREDLLNA
jgi:cyanophycin synthetase